MPSPVWLTTRRGAESSEGWAERLRGDDVEAATARVFVPGSEDHGVRTSWGRSSRSCTVRPGPPPSGPLDSRYPGTPDAPLECVLDGPGDGTSWTDASNWSDDAVPGSSDDVTINASGNPTIQISSGSQSVHSLTSTDPISISGGSLSVAANSTISGGLTMTGGSLSASGSGARSTVTGTTTDSGGSLYAENGASLSLTQLTSYTGNGGTTTLEATGTGSMLTLANLASVTASR